MAILTAILAGSNRGEGGDMLDGIRDMTAFPDLC